MKFMLKEFDIHHRIYKARFNLNIPFSTLTWSYESFFLLYSQRKSSLQLREASGIVIPSIP